MKGLDRIRTPPVYSAMDSRQVVVCVGSSAEEWRVRDVETGGTGETRNAYDSERI